MIKREGKRPRITRPAGSDDEHRQSTGQTPDIRDGQRGVSYQKVERAPRPYGSERAPGSRPERGEDAGNRYQGNSDRYPQSSGSRYSGNRSDGQGGRSGYGERDGNSYRSDNRGGNRTAGGSGYNRREDGGGNRYGAPRTDRRDDGRAPYRRSDDGGRAPYRRGDDDRRGGRQDNGGNRWNRQEPDGNRWGRQEPDGNRWNRHESDGNRHEPDGNRWNRHDSGGSRYGSRDDRGGYGRRDNGGRDNGGRDNGGRDGRRPNYRTDDAGRGRSTRYEERDREAVPRRGKPVDITDRFLKKYENTEYDPNSAYSKKKQLEHRKEHEMEETELRLNRYIAKGGICSRRDADALILAGRVKVNGKVVQQVGVKVQRTDKIEVDGAPVVPEKKVYLLLNKPKDFVTTVDDPLERKTVMTLIEGACKERIYPIGRLDRNTTGVLLFTNDGDLAKKLTHPMYNQKKIYHVFLNKSAKMGDLEQIMQGIELEDGMIKADDVQFASDDRTQVGIEIHSGKNRIVRRIFEHLGYNILRLDRVYFAGITKKNLPRGKWRFLTPEEVNVLKFY